jgi:predicted metal-dependent hydrolase
LQFGGPPCKKQYAQNRGDAFLTAFFKAFYTVGFHPWQQRTRDLLDQWAAEPELMSY